MKILIDRFTNQVCGFSRHATPLELEINVADDCSITKLIQEDPESFTLERILESKYKNILEASQSDHIIADIFLDESDLDLESPLHGANTGHGILQLLPNGQAKTKSITLEAPASIFTLLEFDVDPGLEIYVAGKIFTDGQAILTEPVQTCTIKFVNTTDKPKIVRAYAVGY